MDDPKSVHATYAFELAGKMTKDESDGISNRYALFIEDDEDENSSSTKKEDNGTTITSETSGERISILMVNWRNKCNHSI